VETSSLVEQLDQRTTPHSGDATIVERYRVEGTDSQGRRMLVAQVTMTDPKFYTAPVVLTRRWTQVPNGHLLPYECNEEFWNNRVETLAEKAGAKLPYRAEGLMAPPVPRFIRGDRNARSLHWVSARQPRRTRCA
jgi:hypothetical protein